MQTHEVDKNHDDADGDIRGNNNVVVVDIGTQKVYLSRGYSEKYGCLTSPARPHLRNLPSCFLSLGPQPYNNPPGRPSRDLERTWPLFSAPFQDHLVHDFDAVHSHSDVLHHRG